MRISRSGTRTLDRMTLTQAAYPEYNEFTGALCQVEINISEQADGGHWRFNE
jgi:hypothetical protein